MPAAPTYEDSVFADGYEFFNQSSGFLGLGDINAENTIFSLQFDNRWIEDETEKKEIRKKEYDELNADADNYDDVVIEAFGEEYQFSFYDVRFDNVCKDSYMKYKCDKFDVPLYAVMTKSGELCEFSAGECLTKDGKPLKANTDEEKIRLSVEVIKEIMPNINTEDYTFAISPYSEKTVEVFYKEWQYSNALFVSFNDEGLVHCVHNKFAGVDLDFPKLSEEFYLENAEKS